MNPFVRLSVAAIVVLALCLPPASSALTLPASSDPFDNAVPIGANGSASGVIGTDNAARTFRFEIAVPGELTFSVSSVGPDLRASIVLFDGARQRITDVYRAPKSGAGFQDRVDLSPAGAYYIQLGPTDSVPKAQPFSLSLSLVEVPDRFEINQEHAQAAEVQPNDEWQPYIFPRFDHDWFKVTLPSAGELTVRWTDVDAVLRPAVRFYDGQPHEMSEWQYTAEAGLDGSASLDFWAAGTYYFVLTDVGDNNRSTRPLRMTSTFVPVPDRYEPNQEFAQAATIGPDADTELYIFPRYDHDWISVTVPTAGELTVSWTDVDPVLRPSVRFFDGRPHEMTEWQAAPEPGIDGSGWVDLAAAGTYAFVLADTGDYNRSTRPLKVSTRFVPAPDPFEPNQEFAQSAPVGPNNKFQAWIFPRLDHDWFQVSVESAGELTVTWANVADNLRPAVRFFDKEPHELTEFQHAERAGLPGGGSVDMAGPGPVWFVLMDRSDDNRSTQPLDMETLFTPAPDPYEPNPDQAHAARIELETEIMPCIFPRFDRDWFALNITMTGVLRVIWSDVSPELRPVLRPWDSAGKPLSEPWVAEAAGMGGEMRVKIPDIGVYFLELMQSGDASRSTTPLRLKAWLLPAEDGPAS